MIKQTAGRDNLGNLVPKFPKLMMLYYLGKYGQEKINYL